MDGKSERIGDIWNETNAVSAMSVQPIDEDEEEED